MLIHPGTMSAARRWAYLTGAAVLTMTALAACGSSGGGSASSQAQSTAAASTSAPAASGGAAAGTQLMLTSGHLTDASGRTLYLWVADKGANSTCAGACANAWPPVAGPATAGSGVVSGDLSVTTRSDGSKQVDYAGHPLYYFEGDSSAGATTGQGSDSFGAKWWEVAANGKAITTAMSGAPASASAGGYKYGG